MAGISAPINDIMNRLRTLTDLKLVAVFNNQFRWQEEQKIESFPYPCAFLEVINPVDFYELGQGYQQADIDFCIHIGQDYYNSEAGFIEQNLSIFDLRDAVKSLMNLYKPVSCSNLFCVREEQDYEHTNVYVYKIYFRCAFIDSKGSPLDPAVFDKNYIIKNPPIELEIDKLPFNYTNVFLLAESGKEITDNNNDIYANRIIGTA